MSNGQLSPILIVVGIIVIICICYVIFKGNPTTYSTEVQQKVDPWKVVITIGLVGLALWAYNSVNIEPKRTEQFDGQRWNRHLFDRQQ